jgi:hypothetical protein
MKSATRRPWTPDISQENLIHEPKHDKIKTEK